MDRKTRHHLEEAYTTGDFREDVSIILDQCIVLEEQIENLLKEESDV
jgi:hypothetical protein